MVVAKSSDYANNGNSGDYRFMRAFFQTEDNTGLVMTRNKPRPHSGAPSGDC